MELSTLKKILSLVSLVLLVMLHSSFNVASDATEEALALLKWKAGLQNQNHSLLSSWTLYPVNATNTSMHFNSSAIPCTWFGIVCNNAGSITTINVTNASLNGMFHEFPFMSFPNLAQIDLAINKLNGTIPPHIGNLSKLVYLDLSTNQLSGNIPPEIGQLAHLEVLHLVDNQLNGSIPASLGNLSNLAHLYLYENQLSGSLPPEMGNLSSLVEVYMDSNLLTGHIPSTFGNLKNLTILYIFNNQLFGPIPLELVNLKSLTGLSLHTNNLFGPIPASLGNLGDLTLLHFYNNRFSGSIPEEIGNLKSLVDLELSGNQLNGSLPASIGNLSNLQILYLHENQLSGSIPQEIEKLKLFVLQLDTNQFTGFLPQNICLGGSLQNFTVNDNYFIGPIPKSLGSCMSLVRVRLEGNQFVGNISEDFGVYPKLVLIDLSRNNFYGELSSNWGRCPQLAILQIAGNNITGSIPPEIGNSTQLHILDLSSNNLVGEIPKEFGKLNSLLKVTLSNNQLFGGIPPELGSLTDLEHLDLSMNKLTQSIPENFGDLLKLIYLNLSNNKFSQEIPAQLGKLFQLSELDLSHNFLRGEIPSEISRLESLETLNLSHNSLSGAIPNSFGEMHVLSCVDISYNELQGPVPNSFRNASIGALEGNKGLCGNVSGLLPCKARWDYFAANTTKKLPKMVALAASAFGIGVLMVIVYCFRRRFPSYKFIFFWKKKPQNYQNVEAFLRNYAPLVPKRYSYSEVKKMTNSFRDKLGQGGYGGVYKGKLNDGSLVAVKVLNDSKGNGEEFINEVASISRTSHVNIVTLLGFCFEGSKRALIYEFMPNGSLEKFIYEKTPLKTDRLLGWETLYRIAFGIAQGLEYLHRGCNTRILHFDIKPHNILLDEEFCPKISDFGLAKICTRKESIISMLGARGTAGYIAPELFCRNFGGVSYKSDVYSYGMMVLEMVGGRKNICVGVYCTSEIYFPQWISKRLELGEELELHGVRDEEEKKIARKMILVGLWCIQTGPSNRPSMSRVVEMLQGSLESLPIPPTPFLSSPPRTMANSSTT